MELRYPYYYKEFKCTADKCSDSCCMHWEIDIDKTSLEKYEAWDGPFGDRLRESIYKDDEGGHFKMLSDERCVFLNENGLCDMILEMGEEHLCEICTEHPRFYDEFSFGDEVGVGLCCEAAAKLILDPEISDEIVEDEEAGDFCEPYSEEELAWEAALLDERDELLHEPELLEPLETAFNQPEPIDHVLALLLDLEMISTEWAPMLKELRLRKEEVLARRAEFLECYPQVILQKERLLHYFIYRYYMSARFEEAPEQAVEKKLRFAVASANLILLLDVLKWLTAGDFTEADQINICKLYSQEIEYDPDNVEALEGFYLGQSFFSWD